MATSLSRATGPHGGFDFIGHAMGLALGGLDRMGGVFTHRMQHVVEKPFDFIERLIDQPLAQVVVVTRKAERGQETEHKGPGDKLERVFFHGAKKGDGLRDGLHLSGLVAHRLIGRSGFIHNGSGFDGEPSSGCVQSGVAGSTSPHRRTRRRPARSTALAANTKAAHGISVLILTTSYRPTTSLRIHTGNHVRSRRYLNVQRIEEYSSASPILIVDDEPSIREVLALFLESNGYEVETAKSGQEALEKFPRQTWSAVITDRMMPGMSGDELAASIRTMDAKIPIILVSGQLFDREAGFVFDAVLPKPFTAPALFAALEAAKKSN